MAPHEEHLLRAAATLAQAQRPNGTVFYAPADLVQLGDLRLPLGQYPEILLQRRGKWYIARAASVAKVAR